jgi:hypothetical protein
MPVTCWGVLRGLIDRHRDDRRFNPRLDAILMIRPAPTDFLERGLAAGLVQLFESVEAVAPAPHHATGIGDVAELFRELEQSDWNSSPETTPRFVAPTARARRRA